MLGIGRPFVRKPLPRSQKSPCRPLAPSLARSHRSHATWLTHPAPCRVTRRATLHLPRPPLRLAAFSSKRSTFSTGATRHGLLHRICRGILHRCGELYTDELHASTSLHSYVARRCYAESACCKRMFQVFQIFQKYVASVSYGCCKSRLGYCICCKCFRGILQAFVQSVSSVSDVCCKRFDLDVAYICFTHML